MTTAASASEIDALTNLPPLDLNKTPRSACKNCGATLAGTERSVGLCPLCQDDDNGGRGHRQRQRQRLMRTTDGGTTVGSKVASGPFGGHEMYQGKPGPYSNGGKASAENHADDDPINGTIHPDICPGCRKQYQGGQFQICPTCQDEFIGTPAGTYDQYHAQHQQSKPFMERTTPMDKAPNGPAVMNMSRGREDRQNPIEHKLRQHFPRTPGQVPEMSKEDFPVWDGWQHTLPHGPASPDFLRRSLNSKDDTLQTEGAHGEENRSYANHPLEDIKRVVSNNRKRVRTGPYAGESRLGKNITARHDPETGDHVVRLYDTDVVRHHPNGDVSYNTGGFVSSATKAVMGTWGDPNHSFSTNKRKLFLHDRHEDVAPREHVESEWGGYDRVTPKTHPFHDGMRMGGLSREADYSNAHENQAQSAPRGQGHWGGEAYPVGHRDTFTQGAGATAPVVSWQSGMYERGPRSEMGTGTGRRPMPSYTPAPQRASDFGEGRGRPGENYSPERDRRELEYADRQTPGSDSYDSGFSHYQPSHDLHPPVDEFDVHSHMQEHHGYSPEHLGDMSGSSAMRMHDREHSSGYGPDHKHDDPMNDEAPPLPGEHFDDYNRRMNERQTERMKQRGIEAKVVREIANEALRANPGMSRAAALLLGHKTVDAYPALAAQEF